MGNINQVMSNSKKLCAQAPDGRSEKKISCKCCGHDRKLNRMKCPGWVKRCKQWEEKNHFAKKCKKVLVHNIESEEELEAISVVRVQALGRRAVDARGTNRNNFKLIVVASANILPL